MNINSAAKHLMNDFSCKHWLKKCWIQLEWKIIAINSIFCFQQKNQTYYHRYSTLHLCQNPRRNCTWLKFCQQRYCIFCHPRNAWKWTSIPDWDSQWVHDFHLQILKFNFVFILTKILTCLSLFPQISYYTFQNQRDWFQLIWKKKIKTWKGIFDWNFTFKG